MMTVPGATQLPDPDADRADRDRRYYGEGSLARIAASRVLVVGAGAVGNEICKHLGMIGTGEILLVDPDVVTESNLNRCILFRPGQGEQRLHKVEAIRGAFAEHGFATTVDARPCGIEDVPTGDWADIALTICGVDDDHARYVINRQLLANALESGRSRFLIEGAMGSDFTQCRVLELPRTACLCCNWTPDHLAGVLAERKRRTCLEFFVDTRPIFPAVSTQTSLVGAQMATEAIRILAGLAAYRDSARWPGGGMAPGIGRLLRYETTTARCLSAGMMRNPRCVEPFCRVQRAET